ncbi:MAG: hypothetical protein JRG97_09140 [Deltaproteobacteria bacterium]|nr:hypothetical protein [Deltaproteobacteria bacterium]MBW2051866.1 hypothetical protein [Deltaproteobacteria bacterium]MBW2141222.1 hypothetical protein [Deltaproteobacteria bacterium]MBW2324294.1 hypothetical protein [Deltaproteobacteria bacterium]
MKYPFISPLLSGLVMPGLGQVINRQIIKGFILIILTTIIFLGIFVKVLLDLSAVMGQVMGPDLTLGPDGFSKIITAVRARDLSLLYGLVVVGMGVWAYSVVDAFIVSRRLRGSEREEG